MVVLVWEYCRYKLVKLMSDAWNDAAHKALCTANIYADASFCTLNIYWSFN
jgi:hypothetical protein